MQTQTIKKELLKLERQYWQAMKDKNIEAAMSLTDYPCIIAGPQGVGSIGKKEFSSMMKASPYSLKRFTIKNNAQVRLLSPDVAVLAYEVREELSMNGKIVKHDTFDSSTWVKRHDHWVCAMHTESFRRKGAQ